jgi:hypothetical protein
METGPAGGRGTGRPEPEVRGGDAGQQGEVEPEPIESRGGRTSRTASLVSGLLTELYSCAEDEEAATGGRGSGGHRPRRDSLDSSTEASGSDVFLGGRGGDSRVLQELQERPSPRLQRQYLRQKGECGEGSLSTCARRTAPLRLACTC